MQLLNLRAENVFSIGDISLNLADRGLLLVTGYSDDDKSGNGAGKSSLANHAIVWGLYGQTYDGVRGDAVVNRNSDDKTGKVSIEFLSQGQYYKIIRTRNPNSLELYNMTYAPVKISGRIEKDTQKQIDACLGRSFNTFIQSNLIGPGTERSFFKLSGPEQMEIIESLLPVGDLNLWAARAKEKAKEIKEKTQALRFDLSKLQGKHENMHEYLQQTTNQHYNWVGGFQ